MKIDSQNSSLVIAGSWNPAILNDTGWFARTILETAQGHQFNVTVEMAVAEQAVNKLTFLGLSYIASPTFLVFFIDPADANAAQKAIYAARKILEVLNHTPVSGVGFNFQFTLADLNIKFLEKFPVAPDFETILSDYEIVSRSFENKIKVCDELITVKCQSEGGTGAITLNMHTQVQSPMEALGVLGQGSFSTALARATSIAETLSNETTEQENT
jgi:hypothetical protein